MGPRGVSFLGDVEDTGGGVRNAATWVKTCNLSVLGLLIVLFPTFPKILITVISVHSARLPQVLHKLQQDGITFAILDTPPKIEDIAGDAAKAADLAIIPCKLGAFDLKAIEKTILVGNMAKCPMRIVFNAVRARTSMLHPAKRAVQVYEVDVAPCVIGDRVVFSHSVMEGLGVMEYDAKGKASIEIQALFRYIAKEMEAHDGTTT